MKDHIHILELASRNELPEKIDRNSGVSVQAACELVDAGHLTGIGANSFDGYVIVSPAITLAGRQFLSEQKQKRGVLGFLRRMNPIVKWVAGIAASLVAGWLAKTWFG